jgi:PRA1 family protein
LLYSKEKWDSSGASAAMGRVSASIPESTKSYVGTLLQRQHLRSVSVFFGIGEERPFYVEKTAMSLVVARLKHNTTFFYLNYLLLTFVLFCLTMITSPIPLIGMGLLAGVWMYVIRASQETGTLVISGMYTI